MQESSLSAPAEVVAAYVGMDWAHQKHDVILRAASEPAKVEYRRLAQQPEALMEWVAELQQRFAGKGKILVALEQSRGALIYHLMGYEFLELYPINPSQLASFRATFSPGGAKDDRPDAELICELLYCHRDRLKAWKPDDELTRKLTFLNEGRRKAVDQRTQLANELKSQLKLYFPLALQVLDNDCSTALAADLLLQWPTLDSLQKPSAHKLRKFFYAHNCRQEQKLLERLELIKAAKPLTPDLAVIEPTALRVQLLAQQLKSLLPYIARYEKLIAELFDAHPDSFLFRDLPGAGSALAPRLLAAFGTDRERFEHSMEISSLSGSDRCEGPAAKRAVNTPPSTSAALAQNSCAKAFMSSPLAPSVTALGPRPVTKPSATAAKGIMPLCAPWPLNGSGSSSPVGNSASPTTLNAINKPSKPVVQSTQRSPLKPPQKL